MLRNQRQVKRFQRSGILLKYAAENLSEKDQKSILAAVSLDIEQARAAADQNQWTPEVASKFWAAYNSLCSLISPVSVDTLTTSKTERTFKTWFRSSYTSTLPQRIASNYLYLLLGLLISSVVLSFLTSTVTATNGDIRSLIKTGDPLAEEIALGLSQMRSKSVGDDEDFTRSADKEVQPTAAKATTALGKLYAVADQLYGKTTSLTPVTWKQYAVCGESGADENYCYQKGRAGISKQISNAQSNLDDYHLLARRASDIAEQAQNSRQLDWINYITSIAGYDWCVCLHCKDARRANSNELLFEHFKYQTWRSVDSWRPCWSSNWFWRHRC